MNETWKTTGRSQQYRIFRDKIIVGLLKKEGWRQNAWGEFNGAMIRIKNADFWGTRSVIQNINGTKDLGMITYNHWNSSATVTFQDESYEWKYGSWKHNHWMISRGEDFAKYKVTSFWKGEGVMEIEGVRPELVIIGLYIEDHFKKATAGY